MHRMKKWGGYALAAFAAFYLLSQPKNAAGMVNGVFDGVINGAGQLAVFLSSINLA